MTIPFLYASSATKPTTYSTQAFAFIVVDSFKIIFSAALVLVVIHHAMDPNNRFNENNA